jgi:hypothetical protein
MTPKRLHLDLPGVIRLDDTLGLDDRLGARGSFAAFGPA